MGLHRCDQDVGLTEVLYIGALGSVFHWSDVQQPEAILQEGSCVIVTITARLFRDL